METKNGLFIQTITILLGILFTLFSCKEHPRPLEIPHLVKTATVELQEETSGVTYPGRIKAASNVKLAFRVAGPLKKIYVTEGQRIRKGQLLATLDPRDYQLQYDATRAEYNQVKEETERIIELYRRGSVSINEYDKAVAARKRVTALYRSHQNALNDTRLFAPFDGYIQDKYFEAPEIVNVGTPILSMLNDTHLEVEIDIPASDFIRQKDFTTYYATADIYPGLKLPLELLDITRGANYNQLFSARFRLKRDTLPLLAAGMSVSVRIHFKPSSSEYTRIPISALFEENGQSYVWLYDDEYESIQKLPVEVQQITKEGCAIVRSELKEGELIVSAGVNDLKESDRVRSLPPVPASNVGGLL